MALSSSSPEMGSSRSEASDSESGVHPKQVRKFQRLFPRGVKWVNVKGFVKFFKLFSNGLVWAMFKALSVSDGMYCHWALFGLDCPSNKMATFVPLLVEDFWRSNNCQWVILPSISRSCDLASVNSCKVDAARDCLCALSSVKMQQYREFTWDWRDFFWAANKDKNLPPNGALMRFPLC